MQGTYPAPPVFESAAKNRSCAGISFATWTAPATEFVIAPGDWEHGDVGVYAQTLTI